MRKSPWRTVTKLPERESLEKPRTFDPRRHVVLTPSGKIRLTPSGKIKMTPGNIAFSGAFLLVLVTVLADGYKK